MKIDKLVNITNSTYYKENGKKYVEYTICCLLKEDIFPPVYLQKPYLEFLPLITHNSDDDEDFETNRHYLIYDITDINELKDEKPYLFI